MKYKFHYIIIMVWTWIEMSSHHFYFCEVFMSELISGKEAKLAWANGMGVECRYTNYPEHAGWYDLDTKIGKSEFGLWVFDRENISFRLKPRTITINGIEVPAPFEPKEGEDCRCYYISTTLKHGFDWYHSSHHESYKAAWRTEEEIKQVVAALRQIFKP